MRWAILCLGGTATDEVLAANMLETQMPWISYVPCPGHLAHLIAKILSQIYERQEWIEEGNEDAIFFRNHHTMVALVDHYAPIHYPKIKNLRPLTSPDSRFGMVFFARLRDLELARVYQSVVIDPKYIAEKVPERRGQRARTRQRVLGAQL